MLLSRGGWQWKCIFLSKDGMMYHMELLERLNRKAEKIREDIIKMLEHAGSGHSAGSLGMADIFTTLYFYTLNHDPKNPTWGDRDRVVLSNGHICPVWYATLAHAGYFPIDELQTLREINSRLQGHPHVHSVPGIENTSGPLGQGVSQAVGMALAGKMDDKKYRVYTIMGDGEQEEGQVWEALLYAGDRKLSNMTFIVDRNNIQIDGHTEDVMPLEPLAAKYKAFNMHVIEIDGNNITQVIYALNEAKAITEKPTVVLAYTIPGKGVPFMEGLPVWHGKAPDKQQAKEALHDLRTLQGKIEYV